MALLYKILIWAGIGLLTGGGIFLFIRDYRKTKADNKKLRAEMATLQKDLESQIEGAKLVAIHQHRIQNVKKDQKVYRKKIVEAKNGKEAAAIIDDIIGAHTIRVQNYRKLRH